MPEIDCWTRLCTIRHNEGEQKLYQNINHTNAICRFLGEIDSMTTSLNTMFELPSEPSDADRTFIDAHAHTIREAKFLTERFVQFAIIERKAGDPLPEYLNPKEATHKWLLNKPSVHFVWKLTPMGEDVWKQLELAGQNMVPVDHQTLKISPKLIEDFITIMMDSKTVQYDIIEALLENNFEGSDDLRRKVIYDKLSRTVSPQGYVWIRS